MDLHLETDATSWLDSYIEYLRDIVGATATTRARYSRVVRRFVATSYDGEVGWARLSVQRVMDFVREETATKRGYGRKAPISAVRSYLRFLSWRGVVPMGWDRAIPRTRLAGQASLPRRLSAKQIAQLVDAVMTGEAPRRDRAILLLLAHLALRCADIIALEIDDIDWRGGLLRVCNGKTHRERILPLPYDVGAALADYIQHDRPPGLSRSVFFSVNDPRRPLHDPSAITCMVKRTMVRAGIPLGRLSGAHMFRHTVASRLVNNGATFREVADLLGHKNLLTTSIYAKLDLATLGSVLN